MKRQQPEARDGQANQQDDGMLRVVLDTNVIVSAVISKGKLRELLSRGD